MQFGLASLQQYVKCARGLLRQYAQILPRRQRAEAQQVALFEDLVCAMMLHIKLQAESQLPEQIDQAVIGRPINFHGLGGDEG